jgi:hypothetical protein
MPQVLKRKIKRRTMKEEKKIAEDLDLFLVPASGASQYPSGKGDQLDDIFYFETKNAFNSSIKLDLKDLEKMVLQAGKQLRSPIMLLNFVDDGYRDQFKGLRRPIRFAVIPMEQLAWFRFLDAVYHANSPALLGKYSGVCCPQLGQNVGYNNCSKCTFYTPVCSFAAGKIRPNDQRDILASIIETFPAEEELGKAQDKVQKEEIFVVKRRRGRPRKINV